MIYLVRHGQTDWNLEGRNQGQTDIELNETGIQQAKDTATQLLGIKFDAVFSSPLKRALKTCQIIYPGKIIIDERLKERCNGELEGKVNPKGIVNFNDPNETRYGIEPLSFFKDRLKQFWDFIRKDYQNKNVLVVTHAGVGIWTQVYFNGEPENGNYEQYKIGSGTVLQFKNNSL